MTVFTQVISVLGALLGVTVGWSLTHFSGRHAEQMKKRENVSESIDACAVEMIYLMQHNSNNLRRLKEYSSGSAPRLLDIRKMKYTQRGFLKLGPSEISALPGHIASEMLHFLSFIENNEVEYDALIEEFDVLKQDAEGFQKHAEKLEKRARSAVRRSLLLISDIEKARKKFGKQPVIDLAEWLAASPHEEIRDFQFKEGTKLLR